jgi:hypothetical protein
VIGDNHLISAAMRCVRMILKCFDMLYRKWTLRDGTLKASFIQRPSRDYDRNMRCTRSGCWNSRWPEKRTATLSETYSRSHALDEEAS